jgi:glycosyltransferase involved in cell wall biosynthesis
MVIIVDDSDEKFHEMNQSAFYDLIPSNWDPVYLKNSRSKGNAGAWNTGLEWIGKNDSNAWVAILDDDDTWEPQHLNNCMNAVEGNEDGIVSPIQTIVNGEPLPAEVKNKFTVCDFLRGNPGWQGSNTFLKYSTFQKVGFFDEELSCTHDRDLAIRLLSTPAFRLKILSQVTAKYYSETHRISLTNSPQKKIGMIQFWRKHSWRMSDEDKIAFLERAENMFHLPKELFEVL